jgi:hypothetical protein
MPKLTDVLNHFTISRVLDGPIILTILPPIHEEARRHLRDLREAETFSTPTILNKAIPKTSMLNGTN